jgi:hypothetical protein
MALSDLHLYVRKVSRLAFRGYLLYWQLLCDHLDYMWLSFYFFHRYTTTTTTTNILWLNLCCVGLECMMHSTFKYLVSVKILNLVFKRRSLLFY